MVENGCLAYLAFVKDVSADTPTVELVPVVREFPDIFPASSAEEHEQHVRTVLQILKEKKLYDKFSKYEFWLDSVAFLGYVVSTNGIKVDSKKIEAVHSWPRPSIATKIRSFSGLASWLRFILERLFVCMMCLHLSSRIAKLSLHHIFGELQCELGTQVELSTTFHSQTDKQSERTIQILEDMLKACVIDFGGQWDPFLPLAELTYNNSYQSSIQMAPYKALYEKAMSFSSCLVEPEEAKLLGTGLVHDAL
ncbi:uncharacterized protein [Nicotiana tomentosiformis]|uniref:uncharacterized protein n=1 Tax=Nicotiana tomentosiformis TaxID=4098 RepID=UPI00388CB22C